MRVGNGLADLKEQIEPLSDTEVPVIAECVQMHSVHIFHNQIGLALGSLAGIQHMGDVGVLQRCKNVLFARKAFSEERPGRAAGQHFQGRALYRASNQPLDEVDGANATRTQPANEGVRADSFV